jgi:hypothetical protein
VRSKKDGERRAFAVAVLALALCAGMPAHILAQDNASSPDAFEYPIGRSLDADASRSGGIQPSMRVPRTAETVAAFASGIDVELEYARRWLISY